MPPDPDFTFEGGSIGPAKTDLEPLQPSANPNQWVSAEDWERFRQAFFSLRDAFLSARLLGLEPQATRPVVIGAPIFIWLRDDGQPFLYYAGVDYNLLTALSVPETYATIADLPYPAPTILTNAWVTATRTMYTADTPFWYHDGVAVFPYGIFTSFTPDNLYAGDETTITGDQFVGTVRVFLVGESGGITMECSVVVVSTTELTVTIPDDVGQTVGDSGGPVYPRWRVTNEAGAILGGTGDRFHPNVPTVTSIDPTTAAVASEFVITGTHFVAVEEIRIGGPTGTLVTTYTVDSSTQITAEVPSGAETGAVWVKTTTGSVSGPTLAVGNDELSLDFRSSATLPAGVVVESDGGTVWGERTSGDFVSSVDEVWRDLGGGLAGQALFPAFTNLASTPPGGAGWVNSDVDVTAVAGPDGNSTSANRLTDNSASAVGYSYRVAGWDSAELNRLAGVYYKYGSPAPSRKGGWQFTNAGIALEKLPLYDDTIWRRASLFNRFNYSFSAIPGAFDPWNEEGGSLVSDLGAIDFWGPTQVEGSHHELPYGEGTVGQRRMYLESPALELTCINGDLDVELDLVTFFANLLIHADEVPDDFYVFHRVSADGEDSVRFDKASKAFKMKIRGSDVSGATLTVPGILFRRLLQVRATYRPSTGEWLLGVYLHGVAYEVTGSTTGTALAASTDFYIASKTDGTQQLPCMVRRVHSYADRPVALSTCQIVVLGDSITANQVDSGVNHCGIPCGILTVAEIEAGMRIANLAVPGHRIEDQEAVFSASRFDGDSNVEAEIFMVGVNNILGFGESAATVEGKLQTLVDTLKASNATAKIIACTMTPVGGNSVWSSVNAYIEAESLTDVDQINTAGSDALNDGADAIKPQFYYDAVHPNSLGRVEAVAPTWRDSLVAAGVL